MSRISRYQESISKYMKNKSCITTLESPLKNNIYKLVEESDYLTPIILLTILSNQNKKNKTQLHGYFMGCGIELLMLLCKVADNREYYNKIFTESLLKKMILKISTLINICLSQNIEYIHSSIPKDKNQKILKIFHNSVKILNTKIYDIMDEDPLETTDNIKKTDLLKYNFTETGKPKEKIMSLKQINKDQLLNFIKRKYGSVCQTAIIMGWMLGSGNENIIPQLEKMGECLGIMMKISYDFKNLERDLNSSVNYTYNYILNYGLQEAFELFIDNKTKLLELCIIHDLHSNTMKEVLDVTERRVDIMLEKTKADLKSNYTLSNSSNLSNNKDINDK